MELDDAACMNLLCDFVLCPTFGSSESAADDDESHVQPPAKRPRKREAHHIAALRSTVADLVAQRDALQARKQRVMQSPWEATSRRQAAARFAVEQEHAQLSRAVASQARVLESLQAVLARPQLVDMPILAPRLLDAPSSLRRATAEALVHAEYGRLESIVLASKIHQATSRVQNTSITYDESAHAIRVDCTMAQMHNLTVDQCALAIWKYYNNLVPIEVKDTSFVVLEEWDANLSYGRLIMETPGVEIHCHVVQKRFVEPNRVVICSATIAHDEKFPYDPEAYVLHESTWIAIEAGSKPNIARVYYCGQGSVPCAPKPTPAMPYESLAKSLYTCYNAHLDAVKLVNVPITPSTQPAQTLSGHVENLQQQINGLQSIVLQQQKMLQAMMLSR